MSINKIRVMTIVLCCMMIGFGLWRAAHKPLWNDEHYSLVSSTLGQSYKDIIKGKVAEGNNSPLFYLFQKLQCDSFRYNPPQQWISGQWSVEDVFSQVFLRVQPVVYLAVALSALFYYFSRAYSFGVGLYSIAVAMSSFMIWGYWIQARPYSLWCALSLVQAILLLDIFRKKANEKIDWRPLTWVHGLLAFTSTVAVIQIIAASCVVWLCGHRRWQPYVTMFVLPLAVCLYYYGLAPSYDFFFADGPMALVNANFPKDRIALLVLMVLVLGWHSLKRKPIPRLETAWVVFSVLMIVAFALVLAKLKLQENVNHAGFQVSNRYFMSLTTVGIICTIMSSLYLWRVSTARWLKVVIFIFLAVLLIFRIKRTLSFCA